ncbi:MAG: hypothetical protein AB2693_20195 [Candidatus Thiodiazotropha sp.]
MCDWGALTTCRFQTYCLPRLQSGPGGRDLLLGPGSPQVYLVAGLVVDRISFVPRLLAILGYLLFYCFSDLQ